MKHNYPILWLLLVVNFNISAQSNLEWQEIGPNNFGGIIHGLIIDNRDATRQTLYAGAMGGGVWKTTNGGSSWNYLGCANNYAISCMAQSSDGTIYFGTGDGIMWSGTGWGSSFDEGHAGNGIYEIDPMDHIIPFAFNDDSNQIITSSIGAGINRIAVNLTNSLQIIAATWRGLYQTTDGGVNWSEVQISGITNGQNVTDVKFDSNGGNIFAAIGEVLGDLVKLVMSPDGGLSWYQLTSQKNFGFPAQQGRIEIAISPSHPNYVYIQVAKPGGCTYGLYRTTNAVDSGTSCTWSTLALSDSSFIPFAQDCQGWYDNAIAVSPADSNKVYMGGANMYTYSPHTGVLKVKVFNDPSVDSMDIVEHYLYAINDLNPDEMYVASVLGVFKSTNAISSFTSPDFYSKNNGLNAKGFYTVAAANAGYVTGGTAKGTLTSNLGEESFELANSAGGTFCEYSQLDTNFSFYAFNNSALYRYFNVGQNGLYYFDTVIAPSSQYYPCSFGFGGVFNSPFWLFETKQAWNSRDSILFTATGNYNIGDSVTLTSKTGHISYKYALPVPLNIGSSIKVPDPVKSRILCYTGCGLYMTNDAIDSTSSPHWFKLSNVNGNVVEDASCSADGDLIYVVTNGGTVYKFSGLNQLNYDSIYGTRNPIVDTGHVRFSLVAANRTFEGICVDPNNANVVLATRSLYVFSGTNEMNVWKSTDGGQHWTGQQVGLNGDPAYTVVIVHYNSNNYFVGTEHGIWTSNDAGATWHEDDDGMCNVPVYRLRQIPLLNENCYVLYAATNSRGLWRSFTLTPAGCNTSVGISDNVSKPVDNDFTLFPNPASNKLQLEFELSETRSIKITVFDITGREIQHMERSLSAGSQQILINTTHLTAGTYLVNVESGGVGKTKLLVIE